MAKNITYRVNTAYINRGHPSVGSLDSIQDEDRFKLTLQVMKDLGWIQVGNFGTDIQTGCKADGSLWAYGSVEVTMCKDGENFWTDLAEVEAEVQNRLNNQE